MNCAQKPFLRNWRRMPGMEAVGLFSATLLLSVFVAAPVAQAQTLTVLHYFTNGPNDGANPMGLVAVDRQGNVYGSAPYGGRRNGLCADNGGCGMVFRSSYKNGGWLYTPLYLFQSGNDGWNPQAGVTVGPDGAVYGTTAYGGGTGCGGNGCGTVFKLTPPASFCRMVLCPWTETVLYRFNGYSGDPCCFYGGVIVDAAGNVYGMAEGGGNNGGYGAVYKLSPSIDNNYTWSLIYSFQGTFDGAAPLGNLAMDAAGDLYGTATFGGADGNGTVFKLVRSAQGWTFNLLYTFTGGNDGGHPEGSVVLNGSGNLFGDTAYGGGVWELTPSGGSWTFSLIVPFLGGLESSISLDSAGNIYGTNYADGLYGLGSVFELTYSQGTWTHTIIHSFDGPDDGALPLSNVAFDASGNMYGTTTMGGRDEGYGTAWQLTP